MKEKVIYYTDELNDDFEKTSLKRPELPANYKFKRTNKINNFFSDALYYCIAKPVFKVFNFFSGVRIHDSKKLKEYKNQGMFIYSNHTSFFDVFTIQSCVVKHKRVNIVGYTDASTIPVAKHLCRALGYIPLPSSLKGYKDFIEALRWYTVEMKQDVLIYPEAHIWPYYTKIRPFLDSSFHYPAKFNVPILPIVSTFRKRKFFKKPGIDIRIGEPIYPQEALTTTQNKKYLRDECYKQMVDISSSVEQYEYIKYVKKSDKN